MRMTLLRKVNIAVNLLFLLLAIINLIAYWGTPAIYGWICAIIWCLNGLLLTIFYIE